MIYPLRDHLSSSTWTLWKMQNLDSLQMFKVDLRRQQISQIVEEVQRVVHHLTTEISLQDLRFQAVPYSDTYNGNIKVLAPSQFLVTVPVKGLVGYREAREQRWRYYTLRGTRLPCPLQDPEGLRQWLEAEQFMKSQWQWHEADVNIEGDIVPAKVLQVFRKLVENAIGTCHLSGKVSMLTQLSAVWVAVETSTCQVELELVPTVEIPTVWPEKARWPPCLKRWPSRQRVECIKSFGFALLACSNYHWQQSFLQAEQVLLNQLDEDGGCRRKCFQALRQMKEDVWCPGRRPVVTSHHLQNTIVGGGEKSFGSPERRKVTLTPIPEGGLPPEWSVFLSRSAFGLDQLWSGVRRPRSSRARFCPWMSASSFGKNQGVPKP
ncbi:protein mab-21-like 3 isoform X4 [Felis catus]|uniref:protein mab-21-like 3 isoform X4 n=1 Tax=Felis catus TaxID=9685 RepID=UPI0009487A38|nr:protein mab-21-like 3 isoform X4 [Felis catus]XP_044889261.1 protein mab-21-like 3 isoform X4 [Felis catus]XP_044889262.1 protein mab-21-like 3 isoform X4 [Felis catus]XP_044889263.1 protein mab-21-like 3 isoform X4 [Felis catus]XP_044889264.1 protein mab-21-like 3 isoform X4 [Felis catus]XP_044889265.1 protein mab-21-like 3 isoform X4 [Felis catus]